MFPPHGSRESKRNRFQCFSLSMRRISITRHVPLQRNRILKNRFRQANTGARTQTGEGETWTQIIKAYVNDYVLPSSDDNCVYQVSRHSGLRGFLWMKWWELLEANKQTPILELLSAEEYYTRKAKGQS